MQTPAHLFGKRIGQIGRHARQHVEHEAALQLRRHGAGFLVDRHDAPGVNRLGLVGLGLSVALAADDFVIGVHDLQQAAARLDRAEEHDLDIAPKDVFQERLVHPDRHDRSARIADERLEDLESGTAGRTERAALNPPGDCDLLPGFQ